MTKMIGRILILFIIFIAFGFQAGAAEQYSIEKVTGNVYRFVNDRHRSVFLVTKNGILITDPMNKEAATWLKDEMTCSRGKYGFPATADSDIIKNGCP